MQLSRDGHPVHNEVPGRSRPAEAPARPLRYSELLALGIHPETVQALKVEGVLKPLSRGLYQLRDSEPLGEPDLILVAKRVPGAVFRLLTALALHDLTTQIPHEVHVALKRGRRRPRIDHPTVRVYPVGEEALTQGIERRTKDGTELLITSPERSVADAFRYRKQLGVDLAIETLRARLARTPRRSPGRPARRGAGCPVGASPNVVS